MSGNSPLKKGSGAFRLPDPFFELYVSYETARYFRSDLWPVQLFGFGDRCFLVMHSQCIDAKYDGQVAGDGQYSGGVVIKLVEQVETGDTGYNYGNKQEDRY